jgi:hypothetical protein
LTVVNAITTPLNRTLLSSIGALLSIAPFVVMELSNLRSGKTFPFPPFVVLWFVATAFLLTLTTAIHMTRVETRTARKTLAALLTASSAFLVWFWIMIVIDQMPCFLGLSNCD